MFELTRGATVIAVFLYADGLWGFLAQGGGNNKPPLHFRNLKHMHQFSDKHNYTVTEFDNPLRNT